MLICVLIISTVKIKGQSQGHGSMSNFWRTEVNITGLVLLSVAESNKSHYQFKMFVCVSVIGANADNSADAVDRLLVSSLSSLYRCKMSVI